MPKSPLSQRCYGVAKPPHNNTEIVVISAKNCFKKHCLIVFPRFFLLLGLAILSITKPMNPNVNPNHVFLGAWRVSEYVFQPDSTFVGVIQQIRILEKLENGNIRVTQHMKPDEALNGHPMADFAGEWVFELSVDGRARRYHGPDVVGTGLSWGDGVITGRGLWPRFGHNFSSFGIVINPNSKLAPQRQLTGGKFYNAGEMIANIIGIAEQDETWEESLTSDDKEDLFNGYFPVLAPPYQPHDVWRKWKGVIRSFLPDGSQQSEAAYERLYDDMNWRETGGHEVRFEPLGQRWRVTGNLNGIAKHTSWGLEVEAHQSNGESLEMMEILDAATGNLVGVRRWLKDHALVEVQVLRLNPSRQ